MDVEGRETRQAAVLTAVATVAVMESLRLVFPTSYGVADAAGNGAAAIAVLVVFALPASAPLVRRLLGGRRSVLIVAVAWGVWRLVVQVPGTVPFWLAAVGAVLALSLFSLTFASLPASTATGRLVGLVAGFVLDTLLMVSFVTWEPAWQRSPVPWVVSLGIAAAVVAAAMSARGALSSAAPGPGFGVAAGTALGAVLALETLFLLNPSALASSSGLSLAWSAVIVAATSLLMLLAPAVQRRPSWVVSAGAALVLCAVGLGLPQVDGPAMVVLVVVGQLAAGAVVGAALRPRSPEPGPTRASLGLSLGWLVLMLTTLLYQLHFDAPLPFDNSLVVAAAGALTALALVGGSRWTTSSPPPRRLVALLGVPLLMVVLVAAVLSLNAPGATASSSDRLRVVQWNVRQGVDDEGQLDPAAVADAIAAQDPVDVVVLSEVARGWPLSGDLDLATWLSRALDLPFVWGGAAGGQFGNAVLTRLPVVSSEVVQLPSAGRSQGRSATRLELSLADGRTLRLIGTHLQNNNDQESMAVRMTEIGRVIDLWDDRPLTIVAGDLNPKQGDPPEYPPRVPGRFEEIARLTGAGLTPTTDLSNCSQPTSNANCSDYIFVGPGLEPSTYRVVNVPGFDHRMLVADLRVTPAR